MKLGRGKLLFCGYILCVFLSFSACQNNKAPLAPEKMEALLLDLQTAESYNFWVVAKGDLNKKNQDSLAYYYSKVLKKYELSPKEFKSALEWYFQHPEMMSGVYQATIDSATKFKDKYRRLDHLEVKEVEEAVAPMESITIPEIENNGIGAAIPKKKKSDLDEATKQSEREERELIKNKNSEKQKALNKVKNEQ
ncbi:MAG TPA: DUF4296 domain-containing protein [Edaphocola sp.]|nr:DUF4296 domain-containing protein [Edaphocola sp.]